MPRRRGPDDPNSPGPSARTFDEPPHYTFVRSPPTLAHRVMRRAVLRRVLGDIDFRDDAKVLGRLPQTGPGRWIDLATGYFDPPLPANVFVRKRLQSLLDCRAALRLPHAPRLPALPHPDPLPVVLGPRRGRDLVGTRPRPLRRCPGRPRPPGGRDHARPPPALPVLARPASRPDGELVRPRRLHPPGRLPRPEDRPAEPLLLRLARRRRGPGRDAPPPLGVRGLPAPRRRLRARETVAVALPRPPGAGATRRPAGGSCGSRRSCSCRTGPSAA